MNYDLFGRVARYGALFLVSAIVAFLAGTNGMLAGKGRPERSPQGGVAGMAPHRSGGLVGTQKREAVALGERLFKDVNLSADSTVSCATCHDPVHAFAELREVSHGLGTNARKRNSPSLINVSLSGDSFDWDGRAATLEDQLRGVFDVSGDMGIDFAEAVRRVRADRSYRAAFTRAYGHVPRAADVLSALAEFQRMLLLTESPFDRYYYQGDSSAFTPAERRGWQVFQAKSCAGCHVPFASSTPPYISVFSDGRFHNLGVGYDAGHMADPGRYTVTRRPRDWGAFKTPTLRNIALTAPYMHDGSLATLEEVVDFYVQGGRRNPNVDEALHPQTMSPQERADLIAFMKALTSAVFADTLHVRRHLDSIIAGATTTTHEGPRP